MLSQSVSILGAMRIEIEPARAADEVHAATDTGQADRAGDGWSAEEIARLRSEWDAEPGHR